VRPSDWYPANTRPTSTFATPASPRGLGSQEARRFGPEAPNLTATRLVFLSTILGEDAALFMDCKEILGALGLPPFRALKGFVEIITTEEHLNLMAEDSAESVDPTRGVSTGISPDAETISPGPFIL
jgi:hypothetical protein